MSDSQKHWRLQLFSSALLCIFLWRSNTPAQNKTTPLPAACTFSDNVPGLPRRRNCCLSGLKQQQKSIASNSTRALTNNYSFFSDAIRGASPLTISPAASPTSCLSMSLRLLTSLMRRLMMGHMRVGQATTSGRPTRVTMLLMHPATTSTGMLSLSNPPISVFRPNAAWQMIQGVMAPPAGVATTLASNSKQLLAVCEGRCAQYLRMSRERCPQRADQQVALMTPQTWSIGRAYYEQTWGRKRMTYRMFRKTCLLRWSVLGPIRISFALSMSAPMTGLVSCLKHFTICFNNETQFQYTLGSATCSTTATYTSYSTNQSLNSL